jgi:predicted acylesterase/phospholipase RssA
MARPLAYPRPLEMCYETGILSQQIMGKAEQEKRSAHLVLGAGGVRVMSSVGALVKLEEAGVEWKSISACSAGSVLGALLAAGITAKNLETIILEEDMTQLAGSPLRFGEIRRFLQPPFARYESSGIPEFFTRMVRKYKRFADRSIADLALKDLAIPFSTTGIDINAAELLIYSSDGENKEMCISDVLKLAVSVPGLYPPGTDEQGRQVVDAALATQMPVWLAPDDDLPIFVIAPCGSDSYKEPTSFADFLNTIISTGIICRDQYMISQIPRVRLIEPMCESIHFDSFQEAEKKKEWLIDRGRAAIESAISRQPSGSDIFDISYHPSRWAVRSNISGENKNKSSLELVSQKMSRAMRPKSLRQIFLSYAHKDGEWRERLVRILDPYGLAIWTDENIDPGEQWDLEIKKGLRATRIAILFLSDDFLKSDYIQNKELAHFFDPKNQEIRKLPVLIKECNWRDIPAIANLQLVNSERPLTSYTDSGELDNEINRICMAVQKSLNELENNLCRR